MKKLKFILAFSLITTIAFAQDAWTTDAMAVSPSSNGIFGTYNKRSLYLLTNDSIRAILDSLGKFQLKNLAFEPVTTGELHLVYADENGVLSKGVGMSGSITCGTGIFPWMIGGSNGLANTNGNVIGTCNAYDFILESNAKRSVILKTSGYVGIGEQNSSPGSVLDVSDPDSSSSTSGHREHLRIYGDYNGTMEATGEMNIIYKDNFTISQGTFLAPVNVLNIDGSGNTLIYGKTQIGVQASASNTAMFNVNVAGTSTAAAYALDIFDQHTGKVNFRVKSDGFVYSREVNVQASNFPDYVFKKGYDLKSLDKLESYINKNHHLPNVPSAAEIEKNGANLGELCKVQMEKIEELTLYVISLQKQIDQLKNSDKNFTK